VPKVNPPVLVSGLYYQLLWTQLFRANPTNKLPCNNFTWGQKPIPVPKYCVVFRYQVTEKVNSQQFVPYKLSQHISFLHLSPTQKSEKYKGKFNERILMNRTDSWGTSTSVHECRCTVIQYYTLPVYLPVQNHSKPGKSYCNLLCYQSSVWSGIRIKLSKQLEK
jgi:hypothetical protein